jgi:NadR type nicotinamide-nucleotide adenylyltransferase
MKIGLTLGKFAPLHRGHQLVIETALREMDETLVLIYDCPELETNPLDVRAQWIRDLYPSVRVLEAWDGPTEVGLDPKITKRHDAYLKSRLHDERISHFYCSESYGEHVSAALGVIDRRVDCDRCTVPVSATQIRASPFEFRQYVAPHVYRDLIVHAVFLGAPSTGKTTIANEMASRRNTLWVPEYGREYWERHQVDRRLTLEQLVEIAHGHRACEDTLMVDANRYLFVDTDASTTLQFSYVYHDAAHPELIKAALAARDRYDLFFLCEPDIPYDDTWDRSGEVSRGIMHRRIESDLINRKIPFHRLGGSLENRCVTVDRVLAGFRKTSGKTST